MKTMIVTDLTRFSNSDIFCVAVVDVDTCKCLRPMPYLRCSKCEELNIQPGTILLGNCDINPNSSNPHVEDASYRGLKFRGLSTSEQFEEILNKTLSSSISEGFGHEFDSGQKHIPFGEIAYCSIITIKIDPCDFKIHEDQYIPGKIKLTIKDSSGHRFRYLPITDKGFFDYAKKYQNDRSLFHVQDFINDQEELYLRIGLSRCHEAPDGRNGYWLQVNGIYTFPDYQREIRSY